MTGVAVVSGCYGDGPAAHGMKNILWGRRMSGVYSHLLVHMAMSDWSAVQRCLAKQSNPSQELQHRESDWFNEPMPALRSPLQPHHFPSLPLPPPLLPLYYIHTDTTFSSHHAPFPLTLFSNRPCATGPRDHPARRVPAKLRLEHRAVAAHRSTRTPNILSREDLFEIRLDAPALSYPRLEDGLWPVRVTT